MVTTESIDPDDLQGECLQPDPTQASCVEVSGLEVTCVTPSELSATCLTETEITGECLQPQVAFCCVNVDPIQFYVFFDEYELIAELEQVDVYGLFGLVEERLASGLQDRSIWETCPNYDYCWGPTSEGQADEAYTPDVRGAIETIPYPFRWKTFFDPDTGLVYIARVDLEFQLANSQLFPSPLQVEPTAQISLCFDQNARACYAFEKNTTTIELRRFVASVVTTVNWTGTSPKLFYDGLLQQNVNQQDFVCYYLNAGNICIRVQRDNFLTEYVLATPTSTPTRITRVDKQDDCVVVWVLCENGRYIYRSAQYNPWPLLAGDKLGATLQAPTGEHIEVIVPAGFYADALGAEVQVPTGTYLDSIVSSGPYEDALGAIVDSVTGEYVLIIADGGSYLDELGATLTSVEGEYIETIVTGGSYEDSMGMTVQSPTGSYNAS